MPNDYLDLGLSTRLTENGTNLMESIISGAISSVIAAGALVIIAGMGELMAERTGVINIGLAGIMAMGGVIAVMIEIRWMPNAWVGLLGAALVGLLMGVIFAIITVWLKADQLLTGLGLVLIGDGLSRQIGKSFGGVPTSDAFHQIRLPLLEKIPFLGEGLFNQNLVVYLAYLILPALAYLILYMSRHGIAIRAVGQDPAAADASGVPVDRIRFLYTCIAGMMFGIAGGYLTLALTRSWTEGVASSQGWIIITLVFFSRLDPRYLVLGALLFGGATSMSFIVQVENWGINSYFLKMFPYLVTLLLLLIGNLLRRRSQQGQSGVFPASLTIPYRRE